VNLRKIARRFKMRFSGQPSALSFLPRTKFDYAREVGDGTRSSTVMAPLMWIARVFPEAPPAIWTASEGTEKQVHDHEMLRLLRRPNPYYGGSELWVATLIDYFVDGNSYWIKGRDRGGRVAELWWAPHWTMTPKGTADSFLTHYEYRPGPEKLEVAVEDVVHFRYGLDADDPRRGRSPLKSVLREVFTDDEAANFTASLLRNMGVPGLLVSPDGAAGEISTEEAKEVKTYIKSAFSGERRGEPLVIGAPTKIQQFGFSPEQLNLKDLRRIPEERVSAVIGVPAVVAGLGAGLDRSTFTNFAEAREAGYEETIIPAQRVFGDHLWAQLLPDFERDEATLWSTRVGFDLAHVRVLQPDQDKMATRLNIGVSNGTVRRSEYRRAFGLPVEPGDEVYLVPMNVAEVPVDGSEPRTFTPPRTTDRRGALAAAITAGEPANGHVEVP